ncbi:hypothetical protein F4778DRAFT_785474 [Xylariomycetidae sp. FL2044]|nr:hypothetical protein F4778DRAFT_785474 [Xylariomycetidae sp. FL2044]
MHHLTLYVLWMIILGATALDTRDDTFPPFNVSYFAASGHAVVNATFSFHLQYDTTQPVALCTANLRTGDGNLPDIPYRDGHCRNYTTAAGLLPKVEWSFENLADGGAKFTVQTLLDKSILVDKQGSFQIQHNMIFAATTLIDGDEHQYKSYIGPPAFSMNAVKGSGVGWDSD